MEKPHKRKNPKQNRSSEMLSDILEGTRLGLQKFGVSKLSSTKISEITGISVGSFYQYFKNKEAAFLELSEKMGDTTNKRMFKIFEETSDEPLRERFHFLLDAYIEMFLTHKNYFNMLSQIVIRFNKYDYFINNRRKFHQQIAKILQQETGRDLEECLKFTYFCISNVNGTLHAMGQDNGDYLTVEETKNYLKSTTDFLLDGFINSKN